jgi:hypothetical protein
VRSWNDHRSHLRWPEAHGGIHSQGEPLGACIFCSGATFLMCTPQMLPDDNNATHLKLNTFNFCDFCTLIFSFIKLLDMDGIFTT